MSESSQSWVPSNKQLLYADAHYFDFSFKGEHKEDAHMQLNGTHVFFPQEIMKEFDVELAEKQAQPWSVWASRCTLPVTHPDYLAPIYDTTDVPAPLPSHITSMPVFGVKLTEFRRRFILGIYRKWRYLDAKAMIREGRGAKKRANAHKTWQGQRSKKTVKGREIYVTDIAAVPTWVKVAATYMEMYGLNADEALSLMGKKGGLEAMRRWLKSPALRVWIENVKEMFGKEDPVEAVRMIIERNLLNVAMDKFVALEMAKLAGDYAAVDKISTDIMERAGVVKKQTAEQKNVVHLHIGSGGAQENAGLLQDGTIVTAEWEELGLPDDTEPEDDDA